VFDLIVAKVPGPEVNPDGPLQMLCTTLDFSEYVGRIAIGRIASGRMRKGKKKGRDENQTPRKKSKNKDHEKRKKPKEKEQAK